MNKDTTYYRLPAISRMSSLLDYLHINAKELSEKCGYDRPQAFYDVLKGRTRNISPVMCEKILSVFPAINRSWLLHGEGQMLREPSKVESLPPYCAVPLLPLKALGGSLVGFSDDSVQAYECEIVLSPVDAVDFAIPVYGESMLPMFPNGSRVYVKKINPDAFIQWGHYFVLDTVNGIILKQLQPSDREGYIVCHSTNPSGLYKDFEVSMQDIRSIYRVMACVIPM